MKKISIDKKFDNLRIDKVTKLILPQFGLRACRRIICEKKLLLNNKHVRPGTHVHAGDQIDICIDVTEDNVLFDQPHIIYEDDDFYCIHKPSHLHSVTLKGKFNRSLETFIDSLCNISKDNELFMLQRLDYGTSGIITIAKSEYSLKQFRKAEKENKCRKFYLAILEGKLEFQNIVRSALDVCNRKKTLLLASTSENCGRWTKIFPLVNFGKDIAIKILSATNKKLDLQDGQELTLAGCEIMRGARHQIRAHAASIGHPLFGDGLYGQSGDDFFLHHGAIITPYFKLVSPPTWHLPSDIGAIISGWLKNQIK